MEYPRPPTHAYRHGLFLFFIFFLVCHITGSCILIADRWVMWVWFAAGTHLALAGKRCVVVIIITVVFVICTVIIIASVSSIVIIVTTVSTTTVSNVVLLRLLCAAEPVGNWRDSDTGLGLGRIPFDVNTALMPACLRSIQVGFPITASGVASSWLRLCAEDVGGWRCQCRAITTSSAAQFPSCSSQHRLICHFLGLLCVDIFCVL